MKIIFFFKNFFLKNKFNLKENFTKKFDMKNLIFFENWSNSLLNENYEINSYFKNYFFSNIIKRLKNLFRKNPSLNNILNFDLKKIENLEIIKKKLFSKISKSEIFFQKLILKRVLILIQNLIDIDNIFLINSQKKTTLHKILFFYQKYNFDNLKKKNFIKNQKILNIKKFNNEKYAKIVLFNKIDELRFQENFELKNIFLNCKKKYFIEKLNNAKIPKEKWCEFLSFLKINKNIF